MDKRIELTEKQKEIVARYNAIVKEMAEANIECIYREYWELGAINSEHIKRVSFAEDCNKESGDIEVEFSDIPKIECPIGLCLTWGCDHSFTVEFPDD